MPKETHFKTKQITKLHKEDKIMGVEEFRQLGKTRLTTLKWFDLEVTPNILKGLTREEYYKTYSWLRYARKQIMEQLK